MKEVQLQAKIIQSVRNEGGYGRKWSSDWNVGVPDLVLALPSVGGFLMEVKYEKDLVHTYNRQLGVTKIQYDTMAHFHKSGMKCFVGVVLDYRDNAKPRTLAVGPWDLRRISYHDGLLKVAWTPGGGFPMTKIMEEVMTRYT